MHLCAPGFLALGAPPDVAPPWNLVMHNLQSRARCRQLERLQMQSYSRQMYSRISMQRRIRNVKRVPS